MLLSVCSLDAFFEEAVDFHIGPYYEVLTYLMISKNRAMQILSYFMKF